MAIPDEFFNQSSPANPYQPSMTPMSMGAGGQRTRQLASLMQRFLGALIDGFFPLIFVGPGYGLLIAGSVGQDPDQMDGLTTLSIVGIVMLLAGFLFVAGIQIYLLATRSQSVGKYFVKSQIVDFESGQPADFVHTFLLRVIVNGIIGGLPCVGAIYSLVDIFFVFRDDRRCVHDLLASTVVVDIS